jgi:hypothetical protein
MILSPYGSLWTGFNRRRLAKAALALKNII